MKGKLSPFMHQTVSFVIWMLIYYLSGVISLQLDVPSLDFSVVWFPAGVATAAFLCAPWRQWPVFMVGFIALNLLLDNTTTENFPTNLLFAVLAMPSTMAIAWLVRRFSREGDDLHQIVMWLVATVLVSVIDALVLSSGLRIFRNEAFSSTFWPGLIADVTGILFATTIIMGFLNNHLRTGNMHRRIMIAGCFVWVMLILVTAWIFSDSVKYITDAFDSHRYDVLRFAAACIPIILTVALAILWGNRGGSFALLTLGAIVIWFSIQKMGPFFIKGLREGEPLLIAQCYLTATALLMVFIRVLTRSAQRLDNRTGVQSARDAIYQLNLTTGQLFWDHSLDVLDDISIDELTDKEKMLARVHPDDRDKFQNQWNNIGQAHQLPTISFRFQDNKGRWVTITDSGNVLTNNQSQPIIVGNWRISGTTTFS
ncbi:MASE1 domain-containing protein [Atlantibacter hermannii]|uniref:MASE1 domain-containing protein n=1 Tax=Atlantibacter hermannii TaxID=565 RepID=UPI00289A83DD|nr:MASE1 domain-containing protein [Atlantibacter hermannii]